METFGPLVIGIGCLAYLILIIKNILFTVFESDGGKLSWGVRRKITDWIGFIFLLVSALVVAFFGVGGIVVFIKNIF